MIFIIFLYTFKIQVFIFHFYLQVFLLHPVYNNIIVVCKPMTYFLLSLTCVCNSSTQPFKMKNNKVLFNMAYIIILTPKKLQNRLQPLWSRYQLSVLHINVLLYRLKNSCVGSKLINGRTSSAHRHRASNIN